MNLQNNKKESGVRITRRLVRYYEFRALPMTTKTKIRTSAALGCGSLALAAVHCAGGIPGAMPAPFVLFEAISEAICGLFLLYHAKKLHDKQKLDDSR
jgi:hypothetical protein